MSDKGKKKIDGKPIIKSVLRGFVCALIFRKDSTCLVKVGMEKVHLNITLKLGYCTLSLT